MLAVSPVAGCNVADDDIGDDDIGDDDVAVPLPPQPDKTMAVAMEKAMIKFCCVIRFMSGSFSGVSRDKSVHGAGMPRLIAYGVGAKA